MQVTSRTEWLLRVPEIRAELAVFPTTGVAVNPDLVGVSLTSTLRLSQSPSAVEKEIILNTATLAAEEYSNNLRVGRPEGLLPPVLGKYLY